MQGTRKKYDAKFKAKVALEAIKERETLNDVNFPFLGQPEIRKQYSVFLVFRRMLQLLIDF